MHQITPPHKRSLGEFQTGIPAAGFPNVLWQSAKISPPGPAVEVRGASLILHTPQPILQLVVSAQRFHQQPGRPDRPPAYPVKANQQEQRQGEEHDGVLKGLPGVTDGSQEKGP
jgi:hypothetical protein